MSFYEAFNVVANVLFGILACVVYCGFALLILMMFAHAVGDPFRKDTTKLERAFWLIVSVTLGVLSATAVVYCLNNGINPCDARSLMQGLINFKL